MRKATDSAAALRAVAWQQLPLKVRLHCNRQHPPHPSARKARKNRVGGRANRAKKGESGKGYLCPGSLCAAGDQILSAVIRRDQGANACRWVAHQRTSARPFAHGQSVLRHTLLCYHVELSLTSGEFVLILS